MIISYQWLSEYLPVSLPVEEVSKILTSIGLEVEAVEAAETIKGSLAGLVIGQVLTCEKHPNADKLKVTTVNVGSGEPLKIVCGAPNVAAGQKVIVAQTGTTVHPVDGESFQIKKAKIRGEESNGMLCAEDEIGLGKSHEGLLILPEEAPIGMAASEYFKIPVADHAIHIGLTPNRSDAMSHIGVARDICAYLAHHKGGSYAVKLPEYTLPAAKDNSLPVKINIEAPQACPRYMGISLKNITIAPSPEWLQQRLKTIDIRPINNVVDITNYILNAYGQPLHSFDADKINGHTINVRFLPNGTTFTTLDEKERKLQDTDLMICDAKEPIAMAGVFGGLHSGISEGTKNVFLECAYFNPGTIRKTSLHHGLRTDAATHFEKGVDMNNLPEALKYAASMIATIAGGEVASEIIDAYPLPLTPVTVKVSYDYIRNLSGKKYSQDGIKTILKALAFKITDETADELTLQVPSNKTDVLQPADIVEEIVRIDGLDNVEIPQRLNITLTKAKVNDRASFDKIAETLMSLGFQEIITNSITNSKYYPERNDLVKMLNSLSSELDIMRPSLMESGLEVIEYNYNRKNQDLQLFELGKTYMEVAGKYVEEQKLGLWITGNLDNANWNNKATSANIFYLKSIINNLLSLSGIKSTSVSYAENDEAITWYAGKAILATATKVNSKRAQEFDLKQDVYYAELYWKTWIAQSANNKIKYAEIPKFPAVQRDLAIILDKQVSYNQVEEATKQLSLQPLQSFDLFDVFESEKLGAGKKSFALSYTFQLQDRTLTDAETEQLMQQLMNVYKTKLQATIRE